MHVPPHSLRPHHPTTLNRSAMNLGPSESSYEVVTKYSQRKERLSALLFLRRVYRDILHANMMLQEGSPVYVPTSIHEAEAVDNEEGSSGSSTESMEEDEKEKVLVEQQRRDKALAIVADMQLTSDQLKASLRTLPSAGLKRVFGSQVDAKEERLVLDTAREFATRLRERLNDELPSLPFGGIQQAQALIDAKNARFNRRPPNVSNPSGVDILETGEWALPSPSSLSAIERLEAAEKVAEQFVKQRIKPALRRAQEAELGDLVRGTGSYLKGLWDRLNGGGKGALQGGLEKLGLPLPPLTRKESELAIAQLCMELEQLEKRLQDASRARENRLRKAGPSGRVQMAIQLKGLDADVLDLSRLLAVRTLQLEMEHIYRSLEDEALDMTGYDSGVGEDVRADREGYTSELDLLVADFMMLEEELSALDQALRNAAGSGKASDPRSSHAAAAALGSPSGDGSLTLGLLGEDVLEKLAVEIPDMRTRVGVMDQAVYGGSGFSLTRLQLQVQESLDKVREAIEFLVRGVRLLGSDVANSTRVFTRAALGGTLKPREVSALRRTARDLLAFIPFTIILIIPLTPLGHVLIFGFIQTYFPSFFPSCFTKNRQEIMRKYEDLEKQLLDAKSQAEQAEEEEELARAAAAVARLTAPDQEDSDSPIAGNSGRDDSSSPSSQDPTGSVRIPGSSRNDAMGAGRKAAGLASLSQGVLQPHEAKVRALEERMSEVLEVVNLGETVEEEEVESRESMSKKRKSSPRQ